MYLVTFKCEKPNFCIVGTISEAFDRSPPVDIMEIPMLCDTTNKLHLEFGFMVKDEFEKNYGEYHKPLMNFHHNCTSQNERLLIYEPLPQIPKTKTRGKRVNVEKEIFDRGEYLFEMFGVPRNDKMSDNVYRWITTGKLDHVEKPIEPEDPNQHFFFTPQDPDHSAPEFRNVDDD